MIWIILLGVGLLVAIPALSKSVGFVTTSTASGFRPAFLDRIGTKELEAEATSGKLSAGSFLSGAQAAFAPGRAALAGGAVGAIAGIANIAIGAIAASGEQVHWKMARVTLAQALALAIVGAAEVRNGNKAGRSKVIAAVEATERAFTNAPDFTGWLSIYVRNPKGTPFLSRYFRKHRVKEQWAELLKLEKESR